MDATFDTTTMMLMVLILLPIVGIMMAITPFLMRKNEVFAVTVPEAGQHDGYLKGLKRRYALIVGAITLVLTVLGLVFCLLGSEVATLVVIVAGTFIILIFGYALMLNYRSKVRGYKKAQNWVADRQESVAAVGDESFPHAISLKWNLLYIPVLLITLGIGIAGYSSLPDVVVTHVGLNGVANGWTDKSPMIVLMPVFIQGFMILCFVFSHWSIIHSKKQSNPNAPATSALAYGLFARAQSIYLLVTGLAICILMIAMPLSFMGLITLMQAGIVVMVGAIFVVIGGIAISVVYGQGGSRVFARMQESDTLLADDDQYWKLGIFYYNPEDPSIFLLERFGIGWTVNWARPAVWAIIVAGFLITVGFVVVVTILA